MRPRVYLETSIVSYLAAHPSGDLVTAAHQRITHQWWRTADRHFEIFLSQVVLDEAAAGDPEAAARRLALVAKLPLLGINPEVARFAAALLARVPLPPKAGADAVHIAAAAYHRMDFLLTWNCSHIANARLRPRIEGICRDLGASAPVLCTPEELASEEDDDE
ncbi:MAG: DNA-binding protein [Thermoanaerobaculia bacterium]|nr:DNA-binding protein [Thermoanaerobaculia bacterium]